MRERTHRVGPALASASLLATVVCGTVLALACAAPHSPVRPTPTHRLPHWIDSPLAALGLHLSAGRFYILFLAMAAAYGATVVLGSRLRARWMLVAIVFLHVAFLLTPPILSTDIYNYAIYGRMGALHGLDPYAVVPAAHMTHDPVYPFTAWRHARSAYGPLFTLISYPLAHLGPARAIWSLKALAAAASLGCVALVWHIARRLGHSPARAVAIFGLNPLLLIWTVAAGHNDMLMLLGALAAVALVLARREALGGLALVAGLAVKATAGLVAPFMLLGSRRRWRALAGLVAAGAVLVAVTVAAFPDRAAGLFIALRHDQHMTSFDGIPHEIARWLGLGADVHTIRLAATVLFVAAFLALIVHVIRGGDWIAASGWAFIALVVTSSWFLAWYTIWSLPFAAITRDRRLLVATLALNAYFVANHAPTFLG